MSPLITQAVHPSTPTVQEVAAALRLLLTTQVVTPSIPTVIDHLGAVLTDSSFFRVITYHFMKSFQLHKLTKTGVSTWLFVSNDEANQYYAVGGDKLRVRVAKSKDELKKMYASFKSYGYTKRLPEKKQVLISDPWSSELPVDIQLQLDKLAA